MKKALVGLANNINLNIDKIKLWSKSFKKYCSDEIILLAANASDQEIKECKNLGITTISVVVQDIGKINHKRLEHIANFLEESNIDVFIITDVFDVVFQNDPYMKLELNNYDIFVSGEGLNVNQEPWNSDNINKLFPRDFHKCSNNEVICSGIIAGKKVPLINLYKKMYELCENSTNLHNIQDQAALMVMVYNNQIDKIKIFNLDDAWAMHCAVSGPTQFFDSWGFRNNLKYSIPKLIGNKVYTGNGILFDIVHQFNRIPEWHHCLQRGATIDEY